MADTRRTRPGFSGSCCPCRQWLAAYKLPREIRFEDIPKTSTGKIQKFALRERARSTNAIE